jgi:hypothetical protein
MYGKHVRVLVTFVWYFVTRCHCLARGVCSDAGGCYILQSLQNVTPAVTSLLVSQLSSADTLLLEA